MISPQEILEMSTTRSKKKTIEQGLVLIESINGAKKNDQTDQVSYLIENYQSNFDENSSVKVTPVSSNQSNQRGQSYQSFVQVLKVLLKKIEHRNTNIFKLNPFSCLTECVFTRRISKLCQRGLPTVSNLGHCASKYKTNIIQVA